MLKKIVWLAFAFTFVVMFPSCSKVADTQVTGEQGARERSSEYVSPEKRAMTLKGILNGVFRDQIRYFYAHYGRVPSSYEEWRDSGFLIFTYWSGHPTQPAKHVDYPLSAEIDPHGTFHYECISTFEYKLEVVSNILGPLKVLTYPCNFEKTTLTKTGLTYMEAKADAFWNPLDILWKQKRPDINEKPASLIEVVDGYMSLVPEGFRLPEGVDATGFFEYGFDLSNGYQYGLTNLEQHHFGIAPVMSWGAGMLETEALNSVSDDRLVLFSSDLLKAGYPGLFEQ